MKIRQRIAGMLTAMVCAASVFCMNSNVLIVDAVTYGEKTQYGDYLYYVTLDEDEDGTGDFVIICDCDESATEIEIPAEIDGLPVTIIDYRAFCDCSSLVSVTIPDSITEIRDYAFEGTALLENQTGVKYVDTWVVDCDTNVTSVEIKEGTKVIGNGAFCQCYFLTSVIIPDSVTSIGYEAFYCCCSLTSIIIPNRVTSIGDNAFYGCGLKSVTIPKSVTIIDSGAFEDCFNLEAITILNPECDIYGDESTITHGYDDDNNPYFNGTIYGYKNSTAQTYAENYDITFVALDSEQPTETDPTTETIDSSLATKYGDTNEDSRVNVSDVVTLNLYLLNKTENSLDAVALANADCARNGIIDVSDSSLIMNYIAMIVTYDMLGAL